MRVMNIPGWPPQSGSAYIRETELQQSTDQVNIDRVLGEVQGHISFICRFKGELIPYVLFIRDLKICEKFKKILDEKRGMTLFDIGFLEIPPDKS
jgi:hypothetical protein